MPIPAPPAAAGGLVRTDQASSSSPTAAASSLPRELLRWLASLDLTYPVKNPRRSLSNGYLVSEILYRYYPKDVPLHGMDIGTGRRARASNWGVLERLFTKLDINVPKEAISNTMDELPGAVDTVLGAIYEHVHRRNLQARSSRALDDSGASNKSHDQSGYFGRQLNAPIVESDKIITTAAAATLLSLDAIPPSKILVWDLFVSVTGIRDWADVDKQPDRFDPMVVINKIEKKAIEFGVAFKTDSKPNILHLLSFLWSAFRLEPTSLAFNIASELLIVLSPQLLSNPHHLRDTIVHGLDPLLPLTQLPMLEQKLGVMSKVIAAYLARPLPTAASASIYTNPAAGVDLTLLHYFKTNLPLPLLASFLAGIGTYPGDAAFWDHEVTTIIQQAEREGNGQLARATVSLVGSLVKATGRMNQAMSVFLRKAVESSPISPEAAPTLALAVLNVIEGLGIDATAGGWELFAFARAASIMTDSEAALLVAHSAIAMIGEYPMLSGTIVRLLSAVPDAVLHEVTNGQVSVQPIAYLAPAWVGPLSHLLADQVTRSALAMGVAANSGTLSIITIEPLLPYLVCADSTTNLALLRSAANDLLAHPSPTTWAFLRSLCASIPMSTASLGVQPSSSELDSLVYSLATGIVALLVFHMAHQQHPAWARTARDDVMSATYAHNLADSGRPTGKTVWNVVGVKVEEIWKEAVGKEMRLGGE
ncbi:hypothetical protein BCR44DRAFT_1429839 [Catenaria anguillulae PL171]|uniref:Calponin-homology (CH) domain-containing protein n=1 Tax=Catenaria anguillulae PL171 TaxID=765915 RepID=A0A1Y2HT26_9FUNG|nr:hypothetical protein BCR44DRAFT_1429839 [Catenaria anguillulae PL171]